MSFRSNTITWWLFIWAQGVRRSQNSPIMLFQMHKITHQSNTSNNIDRNRQSFTHFSSEQIIHIKKATRFWSKIIIIITIITVVHGPKKSKREGVPAIFNWQKQHTLQKIIHSQNYTSNNFKEAQEAQKLCFKNLSQPCNSISNRKPTKTNLLQKAPSHQHILNKHTHFNQKKLFHKEKQANANLNPCHPPHLN